MLEKLFIFLFKKNLALQLLIQNSLFASKGLQYIFKNEFNFMLF